MRNHSICVQVKVVNARSQYIHTHRFVIITIFNNCDGDLHLEYLPVHVCVCMYSGNEMVTP